MYDTYWSLTGSIRVVFEFGWHYWELTKGFGQKFSCPIPQSIDSDPIFFVPGLLQSQINLKTNYSYYCYISSFLFFCASSWFIFLRPLPMLTLGVFGTIKEIFTWIKSLLMVGEHYQVGHCLASFRWIPHMPIGLSFRSG